jgi:hypothetical protein
VATTTGGSFPSNNLWSQQLVDHLPSNNLWSQQLVDHLPSNNPWSQQLVDHFQTTICGHNNWIIYQTAVK